MADTNNVLMPPWYTFYDIDTFLSIEGKEMASLLIEAAQKRCPDMFDLYIYNDFHADGVFDLVDMTLALLNKQIMGEEWGDAYVILEALALFIQCEGIWSQREGGRRVRVASKAIGGAALAVFEGLEKACGFNPAEAFLSLENLLHRFCKMSKEGTVCDMAYQPIFRGIARRLFSGKTDADFAHELEILDEWVRGLDSDDDEDDDDDEDEVYDYDPDNDECHNGLPDDNANMNVDQDRDDDDADYPKGKKERTQRRLQKMKEKQAAARATGKPIKRWFAEKDFLLDVPSDLKFPRVWKDYKEFAAKCSSLPVRGPAKWDLTTWTAAKKKRFQLRGTRY